MSTIEASAQDPALDPRRVRRWINRFAALLSLASPEPDPDAWYRADGRMVCPECGALYFDHAKDPREPWLEMLCNGDRAKL